MRIFAISDIHVDYAENMAWVQRLSELEYVDDALLVAGDVSHDMDKLEQALAALRGKFREVFFVPGNHDLWLIRTPFRDSIEKFRHLLRRCADVGVKTAPAKAGEAWVVPLFSWYALPEEGEESLFMPKKGEDPNLDVWSDFHFVTWPELPAGVTPNLYFLRLNDPALARFYAAPVVSFSHFLPRTDLIISTPEEIAASGRPPDPYPSFNFSRVAGAKGLEKQIRMLGAAVHVYGHQHRNRDRLVDGVRYVSYCLGYSRERSEGHLQGRIEPMLVWE